MRPNSLCGNEDFEKALAEIQLDKSHDGACPLWIAMLVQGELGRNNASRRAARASSSSSGSLRTLSRTSSSPCQVRIRVAPCMQADAFKPRRQFRSRTRLAGNRRPPLAARQDPPARRSTKRVQADPRPFLNGSVNAAACQIHVFHLICLATQLRPPIESAGFAGGRCGGSPRRRRRKRRGIHRRNPTCLYSRQVHDSIRLWFPCSY